MYSTRCKFNYNFLNLVLEELMPWFRETYDFSLLEVNRYIYIYLSCMMLYCMHYKWHSCHFRPINSILGFSRETLVSGIETGL